MSQNVELITELDSIPRRCIFYCLHFLLTLIYSDCRTSEALESFDKDLGSGLQIEWRNKPGQQTISQCPVSVSSCLQKGIFKTEG